nr:MAG TPA: hypothetical protein [Caudoviricetes sp.]
MIVQTKNGIMLHGEIAKDPVLRDAGQKQVLKFDLKASRTQDESGKWQSFFVGVNLWHGIDQWDGMLQKGDQVAVFAQKLKEREYNGKTYYDVDADDVVPGGLVTFRWLQQMIDLMAQPGTPPAPEESAADLQDGQMYSGESLADYAPRSTSAQEAAPSAEYDPINDDADDLPF